MRDLTSFIVFFVMVVGTAISKPLWSTLIGNNYLYPTSEANVQPQYLDVAAYQNTHSPYYIYNLHTNLGVPNTILTAGKPGVSHVPAYNFYYGTPIYDFRIPFNPIYPVLTPSYPGLPPKPIFPPTSTEHPFDENDGNDDDDDDDDDSIEKLDSKVDPDEKKPENSEQDDDTITIEAI